jgi:hypothetical protein
MPNTLVVSHPVHEALKRHPTVKDRFKYTSAESVTEAMLARFFEVDRYLVSRAVYTGSNEGAASPSYSFAVGKHALLCFSNPSPSLLTPSAGYVFNWRRAMGGVGGDAGLGIKKFRMDQLDADRIEIEMAWDMKRVAADMGYFFSAAVD